MAAVTPVMTPARDLWSEAAATLSDKDKECLGIEKLKLSKENVSSSVLLMAQQKKAESDKKLWSFSFHGKKILVRDVLQSILSWTKKFQQAAEFIVGLDVSGHAAIPWSAIKFFLDVVGDEFEKYGAMLVGMEFVTREIRFYTIFEVLYLKKPSEATEMLSQSLIKTYAKLLGYLAGAKRYYSESTFKRAVKAPFDDGGVDQMTKDVGNDRTYIEREAGLINKQALDEGLDSVLSAQSELREELKNWRIPLERISLQVTEIHDAAQIAKTKEILDWISLIRYEMHHESAKEGLLENSGRWLLDHNDFNQWKGSPKSLLWVEGIPGSGKTKLSALVAETLMDAASENLDSVAYFYCMRNTAEPQRADPTQILRCIAGQLAYNTTASAIRPAAIKKYEELTQGGIRFKQLDLEQSAQLIMDLTEELASVTIIVDGMDECENIRDLLGKLSWILQQAKIPIRIFIASRNVKEISIRLEGVPYSKIEIGENSGDIGLFVRTEVDHAISDKSLLLGEVSPETKQKIIETLTAGAQGMFQWASLQLESLKKLKDEENVIKELSRLPPKLSDIYAKIYGQISETDTFEIAVKALRFLVCSQKSVTTSAFLTAVCPPPHKAIDSESLLDYCSNLIVEDKALGIFRFAHLSVREYLEGRDDYTPTDTHAVAAEICLACITKTRVGARGRVTAQNAEQTPDVIFEYATMFWPVHCGLSGDKKRVVPPLQPPISSFIMQRRVGNAFSKWMEDARTLAKSLNPEDPLASKLSHCFCSPPNPFFLGCVFGLTEVVERSTMSVTDMSESGRSGLHLASMYGHEKVVQILLGKGAGADSKDTYGRTPLFYAAENGHLNVIEVLLAHDKDIEISPEILSQAAYASRRGEQGKKILELLLSRDGEIHISPDVLYTAIASPTKDFIEGLWNLPQGIEISQTLFNEAAYQDSTEVLEFLIDQHEPDTFKITPKTLRLNLENKPSTATLELLLQLYTELQFPEPVIIAAASFGGLEPLKVLIDYGIDKRFPVQISQDAFEAAAGNSLPGGIELMDFLRGINPDLQITTKVIASAAANENHKQALQMVQYFHAQNQEVQVTDAVVKRAISSGNGDLLKYLLDTFKQLKVTREHVETAAGSWESVALIEVILALNPEIQVDEGLLDIAAKFAKKQVMTSLFDRSKGCRASEKMVLEAAQWGYPEIVEFLITKAPGLQITDKTILAVIKGRVLEYLAKEVLGVFCDHAKEFKPTEDIAIAAAKSDSGREFLGYLIARYGSVPITDAVWKAATCDPRNSVMEFLLGQEIMPRDVESVIASTAVLGCVREVELLHSRAGKEIDLEKWVGIANLSYCAFGDVNVKKVQELISRGVSPDTKHTELGCTPLTMAANVGNEEIVKILLQTGKVDLETREQGKTPLCWAAHRGHKGVVKMLLEAGADWKVVDFENATPIMLATAGDHLDVCEVLKQWDPQVVSNA